MHTNANPTINVWLFFIIIMLPYINNIYFSVTSTQIWLSWMISFSWYAIIETINRITHFTTSHTCFIFQPLHTVLYCTVLYYCTVYTVLLRPSMPHLLCSPFHNCVRIIVPPSIIYCNTLDMFYFFLQPLNFS